MGDDILLPTVWRWPFVPWFCGLNCMPMFILSYQSNIFSICPQLSHSTQCKTGTVGSSADEYGYLCTNCNPHSACIDWLTWKSWSHRYGYIILYFKFAAFYFRFCSSTKSDVCVPSYIWIYITIIYIIYLLFQVSGGSLICKRSHFEAWGLIIFCWEYCSLW